MTPEVFKLPWIGKLIASGILLLYCMGMALPDLIQGWQSAPYEHYGYVLLALWLMPIIAHWIGESRLSLGNPALLVDRFFPVLMYGAILSALGELAAVHLLTHFGLAVACSAFIVSSRPLEPHQKVIEPYCRWTWVGIATLWLPFSGWIAARSEGLWLPPDGTFVLRLLGLVVSGLSFLGILRLTFAARKKKEQFDLVNEISGEKT